MPENEIISEVIRSIDDFTKSSELERTHRRNRELERDVVDLHRQIKLLIHEKGGQLAVRETFHGIVTEVTDRDVRMKVEDAHATLQLCISREDFAEGVAVKIGDNITVDTFVTIRTANLVENPQDHEILENEWQRMGEELRALSQRKPIEL